MHIYSLFVNISTEQFNILYVKSDHFVTKA